MFAQVEISNPEAECSNSNRTKKTEFNSVQSTGLSDGAQLFEFSSVQEKSEDDAYSNHDFPNPDERSDDKVPSDMAEAMCLGSMQERLSDIEVPPVDPQRVRKQINTGFLRRDSAHVKTVFERYRLFKGLEHRDDLSYIPKENLQIALQDLGIEADAKQADALFEEFDPDRSFGLDFDEFLLLLKKSTPISEWTNSLLICELIADAIPKVPGMHPLRVVSKLTRSDMNNICEGMLEGLQRMIWESSVELANAFKAMDKKVHSSEDSKFSMIPMSCGRVNDFHAGIEGRIG